MNPVALKLEQLLGQKVQKADDVLGKRLLKWRIALRMGEVLLLEMFVLSSGRSNDPEFARSLASLADIYVNDAFGTAHRPMLRLLVSLPFYSICRIPDGKRVRILGEKLNHPIRPFLAILGERRYQAKLA
jgi:phosphoglycerate kinase